ncbi:hypothetical protein [Sinomonas halotolerans]|uniref:Antitoxin Xre/MbcA/ParS-like toxin-binding domain-containing protein n=1 Tax=Sinomonas halotolerans TaxID=1644133 RepID=A0ABU9WYY6_9MICC
MPETHPAVPRSVHAAAASKRGTASPQLARALMATENVWASVEGEFGLLTSTGVAELIGSRGKGRSFAADQRGAGRIVGVRRRGVYLYPGFQFDRARGRVLPVVQDLAAAAREAGWDGEDLVLWLVSPSGYFGGARPVDRLDDEAIVERLRQASTVQW